MTRDRNGLEMLEREECLRRLGRAGLGRVAVTVHALPAVFPVNYAVADGGDIVFRTSAGTKLAAAARHTVVAFEADQIDRFEHTGWSVMVVGRSHEVVDPEELAELARLPLSRWPGGGPESVVRIRASMVSGRALVHEAEPADGPQEVAP